MEKQDWTFLGISSLIIALISIIIHISYNPENQKLGFYISLIGSAVTLVALFFSIYQQMQIKSKSIEIEERTKNYENSLRNNLYNWNLTRATNLTEKLYEAIKDSKKNVCLYITQELQNILAACKTTADVHYQTKLTECLCCLPKKDFTKERIEAIIEECKTSCKKDLSDNIVKQNRKLSGVIVALEALTSGNFEAREIKKINKHVIEVRDYLNEIKPDPLTVIKA